MSRRWIYAIFVPVIIGAVVVLGYTSFTTTFNFESWGMRSIVDSTYIVAREKAKRIEQKIIDSDNAFLNLVDIENLDDLKARWARFSDVSHGIDSLFVIDQNRTVVFSVSDFEGEAFAQIQRAYQDAIIPSLELSDGITTTLRHLHIKAGGAYYLVSYKSRLAGNEWLTICLNYNIPYIKSEVLREVLSDLEPSKLYNVVDNDGNVVFGPRIKPSGEFIVLWHIPTTLYEWGIQVAPTQASFYEATSRRKHLYDSITVAIAFSIVLLGLGMLVFMAEQERRLGRLKGDFIANVSHELKTPLSIIRLYAEMLSMGKLKDREKEARYLETISREGERLTALIDSVLDFSKMERGKMAYAMVVEDITPAVNAAVDIARFKLEQEHVALTVDVAPGLPEVRHDPHAVTLALINLLDNASKYAEGTDRVAVAVTHAGGRVQVSVKDWGPGIPKQEQKHIFDRFYRGLDARGKNRRGTGIGLTLVRSIAESHGGRVQVTSPLGGLSRGTEFVMVLG